MDRVSIKKPKLLLGEGNDEVAFFGALLKHLQLDDIQPIQYGGKNGMEAGLASIVDLPDFHTVVSIGITRDADHFANPANPFLPDNRHNSEAQSAFQRVCRILKESKVNLPVPTAPLERAAAGKPAVQIFILPDCTNPGMLEDLCLSSLHSAPGVQCIGDYFACITRETGQQHPIHKLSKARTRLWLASQTEPDLSFGVAAAKGYWNFNHSAFDQIKQFLQAL